MSFQFFENLDCYEDEKINTLSSENEKDKVHEIFESHDKEEISETKEPEMFDELDNEEDFEIPAFLRRQRN